MDEKYKIFDELLCELEDVREDQNNFVIGVTKQINAMIQQFEEYKQTTDAKIADLECSNNDLVERVKWLLLR